MFRGFLIIKWYQKNGRFLDIKVENVAFDGIDQSLAA